MTQPSPSGRPTYQSTLDSFLPLDSEGNFPFNIDQFAEKVAYQLVQKLNNSIPKHKNLAANSSNSQSTISSDASNLIEYLNESQDFKLIIEEKAGYYVATIVPSSYPLLSRFLHHFVGHRDEQMDHL